MNHLDEVLIQRLAEGKTSGVSEGQWQHLQQCNYCQNQVKIYRQIYHHLQATEEAQLLPADFEEQVMNRIGVTSTRDFSWLEYAITLIGAIGSVIMAIFFSPKNGLITSLERWGMIFKRGLGEFIPHILFLLKKSHIQPLWMVSVLVGVLLVFILDRLFIRSRMPY